MKLWSDQLITFLFYLICLYSRIIEGEVVLNYLLQPRPFLGRCYSGNNYEGVTLRYCKSPYCLLGFYVFPNSSKGPKRLEFYSCGSPTSKQQQNFIEICIKNTEYPFEACQNALESVTKCTESRSQDHPQSKVKNLWSVCCEGWRCNRPHHTLEHHPRVQKCNLKKIGCPVDDEAPSIHLGYPRTHSPVFEIFLPILCFSFVLVLVIFGLLYFSIRKEASKKYDSHLKLKRACQFSLTFETGRSTDFESATSFIFIKNIQGKMIDQDLAKILTAIAKKRFVRLAIAQAKLQKLKHYNICSKFSRLFPRGMRRIGHYIPNEVELCFKDFELVHPHVLTIAEKLLAEYRIEQLMPTERTEFKEESTTDHRISLNNFSGLKNSTLSPNTSKTLAVNEESRESSQISGSVTIRPIEELKHIDPEPLIDVEDLSDDYMDEEMTEEQMFELRQLIRSIADRSDWSDLEEEA